MFKFSIVLKYCAIMVFKTIKMLNNAMSTPDSVVTKHFQRFWYYGNKRNCMMTSLVLCYLDNFKMSKGVSK